jgi:lipopolysaccharide export system permease protein
MIINKYITKEIVLNFITITCILLFVALSNKFINLLAKVAVGQLPANLVFKVVLLYIPELLSSLMPLSFFVSVLFVYGRLHADSEMAVLFTCGVNWAHITKVMFWSANVVALIVLSFTTWLLPNITEYREQILMQGEAIAVMQAIVPGQFQVLDEGRLVFYVEDMEKEKKEQLANIFIAEQPQSSVTNTSVSLITAANGCLEHKSNLQNADDFFLILKNGHRYTGIPGTLNYKTIDFTEYGREVKTEEDQTAKVSEEQLMSTLQLLHATKPGEKAELQWRLSLPLSVIVLGLIAVPLAKVSPRHGRFAKFLPAILLYIIYFNLILVTKRWIGAGTLSPYCGMWLVHLGFLALGGILLAKASGRFFQVYKMLRVFKSA